MTGNISEIAENHQQLQLLYKTKLQQNPMLCECYFRKTQKPCDYRKDLSTQAAALLKQSSLWVGSGEPQIPGWR